MQTLIDASIFLVVMVAVFWSFYYIWHSRKQEETRRGTGPAGAPGTRRGPVD